jgi:hypothetical protein
MTDTPQYSTLFSCLYDEQEPVGSLGRGTHYSVLRSVEWLDVTRRPLAVPQIHDFAVVWDEDHDTRVIDAIERIYMAGLLSPVQFIGERKGSLFAIVAARFYFVGTGQDIKAYEKAIDAITQNQPDTWPAYVGSFDRSPGSPAQTILNGIINDTDHRVGVYLANIDSLWGLGTKPFVQRTSWDLEFPPPPPLVPA